MGAPSRPSFIPSAEKCWLLLQRRSPCCPPPSPRMARRRILRRRRREVGHGERVTRLCFPGVGDTRATIAQDCYWCTAVRQSAPHPAGSAALEDHGEKLRRDEVSHSPGLRGQQSDGLRRDAPSRVMHESAVVLSRQASNKKIDGCTLPSLPSSFDPHQPRQALLLQ
jgi:hypothetical protein